jgi:hypothetical protein
MGKQWWIVKNPRYDDDVRKEAPFYAMVFHMNNVMILQVPMVSYC